MNEAGWNAWRGYTATDLHGATFENRKWLLKGG
jgi:hypothetical protein